MELNGKTSIQHINWIDGIKGISCFFIFLHHITLTYYPASYYGSSVTSFANNIDIFLSTSPLSFFINGNFFVFLYLTITGYVTTHYVFHSAPENYGFFHIKRYLKLSVPLILFCVSIFLLDILHITSVQMQSKLSMRSLFKSSLYGILFLGDKTFSGSFWMLKYTFLGGIFVSILATTSWKYDKKKTFVLYSIIFVFLGLIKQIYYASLFAGGLLCLLYESDFIVFNDLKFIKPFRFLFIIMIVIFGAYPTGCIPVNFYKYFPLHNYEFYHLIASSLFILLMVSSNFLQNFFQKDFFLLLSKNSYVFYIVHAYLIAVMSSFNVYLLNHKINYFIAFIITLVFTLLSTIVISYLLNKFIVAKIYKLINKLF